MSFAEKKLVLELIGQEGQVPLPRHFLHCLTPPSSTLAYEEVYLAAHDRCFRCRESVWDGTTEILLQPAGSLVDQFVPSLPVASVPWIQRICVATSVSMDDQGDQKTSVDKAKVIQLLTNDPEQGHSQVLAGRKHCPLARMKPVHSTDELLVASIFVRDDEKAGLLDRLAVAVRLGFAARSDWRPLVPSTRTARAGVSARFAWLKDVIQGAEYATRICKEMGMRLVTEYCNWARDKPWSADRGDLPWDEMLVYLGSIMLGDLRVHSRWKLWGHCPAH